MADGWFLRRKTQTPISKRKRGRDDDKPHRDLNFNQAAPGQPATAAGRSFDHLNLEKLGRARSSAAAPKIDC